MEPDDNNDHDDPKNKQDINDKSGEADAGLHGEPTTEAPPPRNLKNGRDYEEEDDDDED
jgi:hypothetical protein